MNKDKPVLSGLMLAALRYLADDATAESIGWCDVSKFEERTLWALARQGLITRNKAVHTACITGRGRQAIANHIAYNSAEHVRYKRERLNQRVNGMTGGVTGDNDARSDIAPEVTADSQPSPLPHEDTDCTASEQSEACATCLHRAVLERLMERVPDVRALYEAERMRRAAEATFDEILAQMGVGHGD